MPWNADGSKLSLRSFSKVAKKYVGAFIETIENYKGASAPSAYVKPVESAKPSESIKPSAP